MKASLAILVIMAIVAGAVRVYLKEIHEPDEDEMDERNANDRYQYTMTIEEAFREEKELNKQK